MLPIVVLAIAIMALIAFQMGRGKAVALSEGQLSLLHSRPSYHGLYSMLWVAIIGYAVLIVLGTVGSAIIDSMMRGRLDELLVATGESLRDIEKDLRIIDAVKIATGQLASATGPIRQELADYFTGLEDVRVWFVSAATIAAAGATFYVTRNQIELSFRARNRAERILRAILWLAAAIAILTTIGIVLSLIGETLHFFFNQIDGNFTSFFFGTTWSPLSGVHSGVMDPTKVGAIPLFAGTLMITVIAMLVAVPIGLFAAIYLSDFASPRVRAWAKPMLEILAGVPTVVYGFFAAITVAPFIRDTGAAIGLSVASESALAAGIVMGIMIIPFISSLSDDVINAVPQSLRDGSYGLGATKAETIRKVILPAALPGIVSAVLLGISRAIGETMIVVMAAGQGANLTWNPLEAVTTVTVQIVMLLTGDVDMATAGGPAFTLGFTLFCVTLVLNVVALRIVRRYREMYD